MLCELLELVFIMDIYIVYYVTIPSHRIFYKKSALISIRVYEFIVYVHASKCRF